MFEKDGLLAAAPVLPAATGAAVEVAVAVSGVVAMASGVVSAASGVGSVASSVAAAASGVAAAASGVASADSGVAVAASGVSAAASGVAAADSGVVTSAVADVDVFDCEVNESTGNEEEEDEGVPSPLFTIFAETGNGAAGDATTES